MPSLAIQFRAAVKDRLLIGLLFAALLALSLNIAMLLWRLPVLGAAEDIIALHYNVFFGVDETGNWRLAFLSPGFGALCIFANFILALWYHANEHFVSRALVAASLLMNALLVLGSLFVILANI